jgi:hypothetical protein
MATLTVVNSGRTGSLTTDLVSQMLAADVGLTDKFINDPNGQTLFIVNNTGASTCTITLLMNGVKIDGILPANPTVALAAGKQGIIGPFPVQWYTDANGFANVSYSQVAGVKVLPYKLTPNI